MTRAQYRVSGFLLATRVSLMVGIGVLGLAGCRQGTSELKQMNRAAVALPRPALLSHVEDGTALVRVSSVLLAPIAYDSAARTGLLDTTGSYDTALESLLERGLREAFAQELDLSLIEWDAGGRNSAAQKSAGTSHGQSNALPTDTASTRFAGEGTVSKATAVAEAKRRGADAVLHTVLHEYQAREGTAVGASEPAAVYFTMELLTSSGQQVWNASYSFRDQALSDNLFRLKSGLFQSEEGVPVHRGIGFRESQELLLSGFRSAAQNLATERTNLFAGGAVSNAGLRSESSKTQNVNAR